jgi:hypothetical protein
MRPLPSDYRLFHYKTKLRSSKDLKPVPVCLFLAAHYLQPSASCMEKLVALQSHSFKKKIIHSNFNEKTTVNTRFDYSLLFIYAQDIVKDSTKLWTLKGNMSPLNQSSYNKQWLGGGTSNVVILS